MNYKFGMVLASILTLNGCFLELSVEGHGTASAFPSGIVCDENGGACTKSYTAESTEIVTAVPDPGWVFERWELDPPIAEEQACPDRVSPVCTLDMAAAIFDNPAHTSWEVELKAVFTESSEEDVATPILSDVSQWYYSVLQQAPATHIQHAFYGQLVIGAETCFTIVDSIVGLWNFYPGVPPKSSSTYYLENCGEGSVGAVEDDSRQLPLLPSISRDVHLVEIPDADEYTSDTDMRSLGKFTRPHIPPYRGTKDGRIAMQSRTRANAVNNDTDVFHFYLFEPKNVEDSFMSSENGMSIMDSTTPVSFPRTDFVGAATSPNRGTAAAGETLHSAICDATHNNPQTCESDSTKDCYTFTVITPYHNTEEGEIEIWGTVVRAEVTDPKTADAHFDLASSPITVIEAPKLGAIWPGVNNAALLETMITEDGYLMVGRGSTLPIINGGQPTLDGQGHPILTRYNSVYSAYDPNDSELEPCDPSQFSSVFPVAHMPYDPLIKANWGVGLYPWTYPNGDVIPDWADLRGSYPWLDSKGNNIFLSTSHNTNRLFDETTVGNSKYPVRCVDGSVCTAYPDNVNLDLSTIEQSDDTRSKTVIGLWTKGRAVVLDNMLNNIDWGLRMRPSLHREVKLFDGDSGWVRLGSGRENLGDHRQEVIQGSSGNINFLDSIESKFNHMPHMRPNVPRDVAWFVSNGTVTDIVAFDDWVDPHILISSEMVQLKTGVSFIPDFTRIQNGASGLYKTPPAGVIEGAGSVENVALGGTRGKGFFARPSSGLRYDIPVQTSSMSGDTWFVGVFIDPRMMNDTKSRRLLEFPDGSAIDLRGLNHLRFFTPNGVHDDIRFNGDLPYGEYSHLSFRIHPNGDQVEIYRDGMLMADWVNNTEEDLFVMGDGALRLGVRSTGVESQNGFHGWLDDFKVIGKAENLTPEEICSHALGSIVGLNEYSPPDLIKEAKRYPDIFHDSVDSLINPASGSFSQYLCYDHNKNQDGWVDLNKLPIDVVSLRSEILFPEGPLVYNQARPDSHNNFFCLSCHVDDGSGNRPDSLLVNALDPLSLDLEDDPRRQPSQSPRLIFGNIPAMTWGNAPSSDIQANGGQSIDEFIHN